MTKYNRVFCKRPRALGGATPVWVSASAGGCGVFDIPRTNSHWACIAHWILRGLHLLLALVTLRSMHVFSSSIKLCAWSSSAWVFMASTSMTSFPDSMMALLAVSFQLGCPPWLEEPLVPGPAACWAVYPLGSPALLLVLRFWLPPSHVGVCTVLLGQLSLPVLLPLSVACPVHIYTPFLLCPVAPDVHSAGDEPRLLWQWQHPKLGESLGN